MPKPTLREKGIKADWLPHRADTDSKGCDSCARGNSQVRWLGIISLDDKVSLRLCPAHLKALRDRIDQMVDPPAARHLR